MKLINTLFSGTFLMAPKGALWAIGGMTVAAFMEQAGVDSSVYKMVALAFVVIGALSIALSFYNGKQDDKRAAAVAAEWDAEAKAAKEAAEKAKAEGQQ